MAKKNSRSKALRQGIQRKPGTASEQRLGRALEVVHANVPADLTACRENEQEAISQTNSWFRGSPNIIGTAVGPKASKKKWTGEWAVQVFVDAKPPSETIPDYEHVRPIQIGRSELPVDVIEVSKVELHALPGHGIGPGASPVGSIGALLIDANRHVYAVTAAHVVCQSQTGHGRRMRLIGRNERVFYYGQSGARNQEQVLGVVWDRFVPDFSAQLNPSDGWPWQNVDAALVKLESKLPNSFDRELIPYGRPKRPKVGDEVGLVGVGSGGVGMSGPVINNWFSIKQKHLVLADSRGMLRPVAYNGLCAGLYECGPGDSGAPVVRDDGALMGFHIAGLYTKDLPGHPNTGGEDGSVIAGLFIPATRVLGRWPILRLVCN